MRALIVFSTKQQAQSGLKTNFREWLERLCRPELGDHVVWYRRGAHFFRVIFATGRPNPGFPALDGQDAIDGEMVRNVKAGTAELGNPRSNIDNVAKFYRFKKAGADVYERNPHDVEGSCKFVRPYAKCGLEQKPRT
jgi:hypothetical protein